MTRFEDFEIPPEAVLVGARFHTECGLANLAFPVIDSLTNCPF